MNGSRGLSALLVTMAGIGLATPAAAGPASTPADPAMQVQPLRWTIQTFDLGAVFADGSPAGADSGDCFRAGTWASFDHGMLELTWAMQGLQAGLPVTFTSRKASDGAAEHIVTRGRCRDVLSMRTEVRHGDTWQEAGSETDAPHGGASTRQALDAQDAAATNERSRKNLAAMKTAAFGAKADTDVTTMTSRLGRFADGCPQASGMAVFTQRAVYLHMPWERSAAMVPSLSRDADGTTAHLMLQWPACRIDLRVSRDVMVGTRWQAAALAAAPP